MTQTLNAGVLCEPRGLLRYQEKALTLLKQTEGVGLSFCFHLSLPDVGPKPSPTLIEKARRRLIDVVLSKTDLERRGDVPDLPKLPLTGQRHGAHSVHLVPESAALLQSLGLDILVNFTNHILRGDILTLPRHGVWSYHHGDPNQFRGYPPGFWEIYHAAPTTGAILQKLEHRLDDGVVLRKATFPTIHDSYYRQREKLFNLSIPWLSEVATDILGGEEPDFEKSEPPTQAPIYSRPTHAQLLLFFLLLLKNKILPTHKAILPDGKRIQY